MDVLKKSTKKGCGDEKVSFQTLTDDPAQEKFSGRENVSFFIGGSTARDTITKAVEVLTRAN
jgi:hypothetical protein